MTDLKSALLLYGWDQKAAALLGLALLGSLDAPGILVGPLASFGTAHTLRTLASRPHQPRAMAWITGICFCFSGLMSWILGCCLPVAQTRLFLCVLAFMIVKHKRLPPPLPCNPEDGHSI